MSRDVFLVSRYPAGWDCGLLGEYVSAWWTEEDALNEVKRLVDGLRRLYPGRLIARGGESRVEVDFREEDGRKREVEAISVVRQPVRETRPSACRAIFLIWLLDYGGDEHRLHDVCFTRERADAYLRQLGEEVVEESDERYGYRVMRLEVGSRSDVVQGRGAYPLPTHPLIALAMQAVSEGAEEMIELKF